MNGTITIPQGTDHTLKIVSLGDLTDSTVYVNVRDASGRTVISKSTGVPAEGAIVSPATAGVARIYFVPADTEELTVGAKYFFDALKVDGAGKKHQACSVRRFFVGDRIATS